MCWTVSFGGCFLSRSQSSSKYEMVPRMAQYRLTVKGAGAPLNPIAVIHRGDARCVAPALGICAVNDVASRTLRVCVTAGNLGTTSATTTLLREAGSTCPRNGGQISSSGP